MKLCDQCGREVQKVYPVKDCELCAGCVDEYYGFTPEEVFDLPTEEDDDD